MLLRWCIYKAQLVGKQFYGYSLELILVGCAQTAAVGDPMEVVGLLFFCALKFVRLLIQV